MAIIYLPQKKPVNNQEFTAKLETKTELVELAKLPDNHITIYDAHGNSKDIVLNQKQNEFVRLLASGQSCVLLGAAGTGKTTCTLAAIQALLDSGIVPNIFGDHKYLKAGLPAIVITAYTRRAVANIKRVQSTDIQQNCLTVHKLLEYKPTYYEVYDPVKDKVRTTMRFEASRSMINPLDSSLQIFVIDESSMLSVELFTELELAISRTDKKPIFVFIGDIQQLPPVFGSAILGFKINELPTIELTEVYRQALESPILALAHRVLSGRILHWPELEQDWINKSDQLQIIPWPKKIGAEKAMIEAFKLMRQGYDSGTYDPDNDIILCPFVKSFGTANLNKYIANHIAKKNNRLTYQIIAGFEKYYYSIGDKVLFDKEDCIVLDIEINSKYIGKPFIEASHTLDYFGYDSAGSVTHFDMGTGIDLEMGIDGLIGYSEAIEESERTILASHTMTIEIVDSGEVVKISSLSDYRKLDFAYCLSVHKSQGSEWRKVFLLLHHSHNCMIKRELLYTAITRAREKLVIICEKDTFVGGIMKQAIKGDTLHEKAEYFKGKIADKYS